ncbi:cytochrome P450 4F1-like isoform X4 [Dreissena polymorpha]|uniref:cytochrome P450 4F1-like isoform X4 n=1 Tax=Dreissena polymorpha TaxID=45954 RepID=UPI0022648DF2|nr:cytochrome P450 4F1-like isoform X4 [Dreissena polymorpha]
MDVKWLPQLTVSQLVLTLFAIYAVYLVCIFAAYIWRINRIFRDVPCKQRHWLYGNMHLLPTTCSEDRLLFSLGMTNEFKRYYVWWVTFAKASLTVCHPETVRVVMKSSQPKPTGFGGVYRFGLPWLGEGLLIAKGDKWARSRRLLTPAFHFDILKQYIAVYNDATNQLADNIEKFVDSGKKFDVFPHVSNLTLDIILRCAFSYQTDCQQDTGSSRHPYVQAVEELVMAWADRSRTPWLYPDCVFYLTPMGRKFRRNCDFVHKVAVEVIDKRREALQKSGKEPEKKYLDFLDILLKAKDDNNVGLSPMEIRNEVDTFLFEGHDTTASALSWALHTLAKHPEHQRKCQAEIDDILKDRGSDEILHSDLPKLEYLTMCIKESMRDNPPVPIIQREFTSDFTIDGKTFPAGTTVSLQLFGLHHNNINNISIITNLILQPERPLPSSYSASIITISITSRS